MEASELMVGDYIFFYGRKKKIEDFEQLERLASAEYDLNYNQEKIDDVFRPIPITREILEKAGYKVIDAVWFDEKRQYCRWENKDAWTEQCTLHYDNTEEEWYAEVENRIQGNLIQGYFSFVHELQHALRFCEIEKEIVL